MEEQMNRRILYMIVSFMVLFLVQGTTVRAASEGAGGTPSPAPTAAPEKTPPPSPTAAPSAVPTAQPPEEKKIKKIDVLSTVTRVAYGDHFDTSFISVQVTYEDNSISIAKPDTISTLDTSRLGEQKNKVTYSGKEAEFT